MNFKKTIFFILALSLITIGELYSAPVMSEIPKKVLLVSQEVETTPTKSRDGCVLQLSNDLICTKSREGSVLLGV